MKDNETIRSIVERQSCRKFLTDKIDPEIVETIVTAGTYAPNAGGQQPWTITVVTNPDLLAHVGNMMEQDLREHMPGFDPSMVVNHHGTMGHILFGPQFAPLLIVVSEAPAQQTPVVSSALACENMMVAAQSFGISSCWLGAVTANVIRPQLEDPDGDVQIKKLVPTGNNLIGAIAFGYPAEDGFRTPRVERREEAVVYLG